MSNIEWTDETWNPTTGCDRVSPGCDNCYALTMSARLKAMGQAKYQTDGRPETSGPGFGVQTHPDTLDQPRRWHKPRRVFVDSMSDLFHPEVPDEFIHRVWEVMEWTPRHTYQVLTKRPARMRAFLRDRFAQHREYAEKFDACPTEAMRTSPAAQMARQWADPSGRPHIWVGVSVEDQVTADQRIPQLLATPAAVRLLSCEPLLGPVDLTGIGDGVTRQTLPDRYEDEHEGEPVCVGHGMWLPCTQGCAHIDWVIVGGESGPGARPMDPAWARSIVGQCKAAGVATFVKQLGSQPMYSGPAGMEHHYRVSGKGGDPAEWPVDLRVREFPEVVPA